MEDKKRRQEERREKRQWKRKIGGMRKKMKREIEVNSKEAGPRIVDCAVSGFFTLHLWKLFSSMKAFSALLSVFLSVHPSVRLSTRLILFHPFQHYNNHRLPVSHSPLLSSTFFPAFASLFLLFGCHILSCPVLHIVPLVHLYLYLYSLSSFNPSLSLPFYLLTCISISLIFSYSPSLFIHSLSNFFLYIFSLRLKFTHSSLFQLNNSRKEHYHSVTNFTISSSHPSVQFFLKYCLAS